MSVKISDPSIIIVNVNGGLMSYPPLVIADSVYLNYPVVITGIIP